MGHTQQKKLTSKVGAYEDVIKSVADKLDILESTGGKNALTEIKALIG